MDQSHLRQVADALLQWTNFDAHCALLSSLFHNLIMAVSKLVLFLLAMGLVVWIAFARLQRYFTSPVEPRNNHRTPFDNARYCRHRKEFDNALRPLENDPNITRTVSITVNPRVLLIGESGSGKSSLLAAITQIPLPTAEGVTNDRCAIMVRLTRGRRQGLLPLYQVSVNNPEEGLQCIGETTDKGELQELIREAHLIATVAEVPISRDRIEINVLGAEIDAEFIELPGLNPVIHLPLCYIVDENRTEIRRLKMA